MGMVERRTAAVTWPLGSGYGSHRAIVETDRPSEAAAIIEWRRRDAEPEKVGVRVKHQATGEEIMDVQIARSDRELGEIVFRAPYAGIYEIYYMPYTIGGAGTHVPVVQYLRAEEMAPNPAWLESRGEDVVEAKLIALESRTDFDRFDPMEVPAVEREMQALRAKHANEEFLLFPEDRLYPIRMQRELPQRWIERGPGESFRGTCRPDEYYVFQIGVWAWSDLAELAVTTRQADRGGALPEAAVACFHTEGTDCLGRWFERKVTVPSHAVQPLWFGVDVPSDAEGLYAFDIEISAAGASKTVRIELQVEGEPIPDRGDGDLWRLSRLRWLNSDIGHDSCISTGYLPLQVEDRQVSCLGRAVAFGDAGFPSSIRSYFSRTGDAIAEEAEEILHSAVELKAEWGDEQLIWKAGGTQLEQVGTGRVLVHSSMSADGLQADVRTTMEFDGHLDTVVTLRAERDVTLENLHLLVPVRKEAATYLMGMGKQGGVRPKEWRYAWDADRANNAVWIGAPHAGIQLKLKHTEDVWEVYNYRKQGVPDSWSNGGQGGCMIEERDEAVVIDAFTGSRSLQAGESVTLRYSLLITPLKPIDSDAHWEQRYHHIDTWKEDMPSLEEAVQAKATIVNLHQGGALNAYINYPFLKSAEIREQVERAHELGLMYKIYYTVRELSNHAAELWAIRSLGDEVLRSGPGFRLADHFLEEKHQEMTGGPWLVEHLPEGFIPAWQQILKDGDYDSAISVNGLTRWHNHYLEGLAWLIGKDGLDGIYLDGVGYDRQIMKRVRKTMDSVKEGCLIDFHCGNDFDPRYGMNSPMNAYLELMPSIDSLWLGEGYNYETQPPDYWLTEVTGIPFGLMGDMLSKGGNPWRGMLFGMTCRYGWQQGGNPVPLWEFWQSFGMNGVKMHGWWSEGCPVRTNRDDVLATVYAKEGKALIAIASWAEETVPVRLHIDWTTLGLSPERTDMELPYIEAFQEQRRLANDEETLQVEPRRGRLIVLTSHDVKH